MHPWDHVENHLLWYNRGMSSPPAALTTDAIRQATEAWEMERLHPLATKSVDSQGQRSDQGSAFGVDTKPAQPCPIRTVFQRDRDRILHSKAFRRLSHKTQVFISPQGDHYRTRLTHSLEVAQVARTIARALRLNEDLTEAIALGHDLGHPPFGHSGESILDELAKASAQTNGDHDITGFHHENYSVRIVTLLEPLHLTQETLDGMGDQLSKHQPRTMEAQIVKLADRITYLHHDVEDAVRAGLMSENDISTDIRSCLGQTRSQRLDTLIQDIVGQTQQAMVNGQPTVVMTPDIEKAMLQLRKWMFESIYLSAAQTTQHGHVKRVIEGLFTYYHANPEAMPIHFQLEAYGDIEEKPSVARRVVDFIAGMTDRYAIETYQQQLLPRPYISKRDKNL